MIERKIARPHSNSEPDSDTLLELAVGQVLLSRYEIVEFLGRGGMGQVFKVRDRALDEFVALKTLRPAGADAEEQISRLRSEIKLARRVNHQNVCRVLEYAQEGSTHFITMELIAGESVGQFRKRENPTVDQTLDIVTQACLGLQAIHAAGIVHRDFKTNNLMRTTNGRVLVTDFGLAKAAEGGTSLTTTGTIVGSAAYMSPEQCRGERADYRSDIYSVGIVLFELLTGELPIRGNGAMDTVYRQIHQPPQLDSKALPAPLVPLLRRALEKDPEARPADVGELLRDLQDAHSALRARASRTRKMTAPASPRVPTRGAGPKLTTPPQPRPSRRLGLGILGGSLAVCGLAWWVLGSWQGQDPMGRPAAVRPRSLPSPGPERTPLATPSATPPVASPLPDGVAKKLEELRDPSVNVALASIKDEHAPIRAAAAAALGKIGPKAPGMVELRTGEQIAVARFLQVDGGYAIFERPAGDSFAVLRDQVLSPTLKNLAPGSSVRPPVLPPLLAALADPDVGVRINVCRAIGAFGASARGASDSLRRVESRDPEMSVRVAAREARLRVESKQ